MKTKKILNIKKDQLFYLDDFKIKTPEVVPAKFYLGPKYDYQHLTQKELLCVKDLIKGMTIPEVASMRHLSIRTIEKHMENIKQKLNCKSQLELGYLLAQLGIQIDNIT